jgi:hypothetical protein
MIRGFLLWGGNGAGMDIGMRKFYERRWRELAGEVWVDVLHRKTPGIWAETVENTPLYICKKIRHFLRSADIRGIRANKAGLN